MVTKTKLTITIDENLLRIFDGCCDYTSINKSKLISGMIRQWCEGTLPIPDKYLPDEFRGSDLEKKWDKIK